MSSKREHQIKNILLNLTLEEKSSLCSGKDFWSLKGIERFELPSLLLTDGPHGLRKQTQGSDHLGLNESNPATCFPTASALGASWDRELMSEIGIALGDECREEKVSILLGPGVNSKRSPLCGRNFEYFSEDPFLSGELAASKIRAIQSRGIGTSLKHFVANNQETFRMSIDTVVDERTLREIYLSAFEIAVKKGKPWSVMSAYNQVNSEYCSESYTLLTKILRHEWGFEGVVISDWGATVDRVASVAAGMDLEMPGSSLETDASIVEAVTNRTLSESQLDTVVERILNLILNASDTLTEHALFKHVPEDHHDIAQRAASESMVLLKNDNSLLPLDLRIDNSIGIIGEFADVPRYQGSGSSRINPRQLENIVDRLHHFSAEGEDVLYAQGYRSSCDTDDEELLAQAIALAKEVETVVFFGGLTDSYEVEGIDRESLSLPPNQNRLIEAITAVNSSVVVVLSNGAPIQMPWLESVSSVLECYLTGQAWGAAVVDILIGKVNPSGKLAETFPLNLEQIPSTPNFPAGPHTVEYRENIAIGYRYFSTANVPVLFPFGHGLSYTSFSYSKLICPSKANLIEPVELSVTIANSGEFEGKEIVQVYVRKPLSSIIRADLELREFEKVYLVHGEMKELHFYLPKRAFSFWDVGHGDWRVEDGEYEIIIAASINDIRCRQTITITTGDALSREVRTQKRSTLPLFDRSFHWNSAEQFKKLLRRELPLNHRHKSEPFTAKSTLSEISHTFIGAILNKLIHSGLKRAMNAEETETLVAQSQKMVDEMPLRQLVMVTQGKVSHRKLQILLLFINGKWFAGVARIIRTLFRM